LNNAPENSDNSRILTIKNESGHSRKKVVKNGNKVVRKTKIRGKTEWFEVRKYSFAIYNQYTLSKRTQDLWPGNEGVQKFTATCRNSRTGVKVLNIDWKQYW